jgi:hypothetical protein
MAATDIVTPTKQTFYVGDISYLRAVSESLLRKFASASNYLNERIYVQDKIVYGGFFNANSYDNGAGGVIRVRRDSEINEYYMYIRSTGSSSASAINFDVYDSTGVFVNSLFDLQTLTISGNNGVNVMVGKQDVNLTPSNIALNTSGHTVDYGTLNLTTLLAGYTLVPQIEANGLNAFNMTFNLKLQEL